MRSVSSFAISVLVTTNFLSVKNKLETGTLLAFFLVHVWKCETCVANFLLRFKVNKFLRLHITLKWRNYDGFTARNRRLSAFDPNRGLRRLLKLPYHCIIITKLFMNHTSSARNYTHFYYYCK